MIILENDELKLYRGEDFAISRHITIHQPSLDEICSYGERDYYSMVCQLTATPQSMKWQLWSMGIDYTKLTPFEMFCGFLFSIYPKEKTSILFGNLDFRKFQATQREEDGSPLLRQVIRKNCAGDIQEEEIIIDEYTYLVITDYLRQMHFIHKDEKLPANEATKTILIEDAREEYLRNKGKPFHSPLQNMVSAMVNSEGFKYSHSEVWDMKINAFMDSVKRISKIKNAELLLQSGYSGFGVNLKEIPNKQLDWIGELA